MSSNNECLQKLCVKNPAPGTWTINVASKTTSSVYFQFQTVPTKDPYKVMHDTLSPDTILGSDWEDIAFQSSAYILDSKSAVNAASKEELEGVAVIAVAARLAIALVGTITVIAAIKLTNNIESSTETVINASKPTRPTIPKILFCDANGADIVTEVEHLSRAEFLYPTVESGDFRGNFTKLIGKGEATKKKFQEQLKNEKIKAVSVSGHGNKDEIYGYLDKKEMKEESTPILTTDDVTDDPSLAKGKIFHFLACKTGLKDGLGDALISNEAVAYIGYNADFEFYKNITDSSSWIVEPDCEIDKALLDGKTVNEAVLLGKAHYHKLINRWWYPFGKGALKNDVDALIVKGKGDAKIV